MKIIYIAGPFRGRSHWEIAQNIRRAEELALRVWAIGAAALCPHANTAHFQDALPDSIWLEGDLALLEKCDGMILTADWERSTGARIERDYAQAHGIQIFYDVVELAKWLGVLTRSRSGGAWCVGDVGADAGGSGD